MRFFIKNLLNTATTHLYNKHIENVLNEDEALEK